MKKTALARTMMVTALCMTSALAPVMAQEFRGFVQGRTGLPTVWEEKENVRIEQGKVDLQVAGKNLHVKQDFWLHYPGPPTETGPIRARFAVREDYFRTLDQSEKSLLVDELKGFTSFKVHADSYRVWPMAERWEWNDRKDTATRWRNWYMTFYPGQTRRMVIHSVAPLGTYNGQRMIDFVSKDLGHWRGSPEYLQIRALLPGASETMLATLEPDANAINRGAIRWVYRDKDPDRDVRLILPASYRTASR
jgi:hypothetical protein